MAPKGGVAQCTANVALLLLIALDPLASPNAWPTSIRLISSILVRRLYLRIMKDSPDRIDCRP